LPENRPTLTAAGRIDCDNEEAVVIGLTGALLWNRLEDALNEEARQILMSHSTTMARDNITGLDMFQVKRELEEEGDHPVRLTREKMMQLARGHRYLDERASSPTPRTSARDLQVHLNEGKIDEAITAVRQKIETRSAAFPRSEEWDILSQVFRGGVGASAALAVSSPETSMFGCIGGVFRLFVVVILASWAAPSQRRTPTVRAGPPYRRSAQ
jgi:hypothetical protein